MVPSCRVIELPRIPDPRGNLTFIEGRNHIPFEIQRAYWIYEVPGGEVRGGHAYVELEEFFVALSGSFDVVISDGDEDSRVTLNRSYRGLYVPRMIWRGLENFSTNAVCLILASRHYDESDYVRDSERYRELVGERAAG
jgi:dTDP-4-dehydrorhamnose 3,5-epimerase-like enzyme